MGHVKYCYEASFSVEVKMKTVQKRFDALQVNENIFTSHVIYNHFSFDYLKELRVNFSRKVSPNLLQNSLIFLKNHMSLIFFFYTLKLMLLTHVYGSKWKVEIKEPSFLTLCANIEPAVSNQRPIF